MDADATISFQVDDVHFEAKTKTYSDEKFVYN